MWSFRLAAASVPLVVWLGACSAKTRDIGPAPGVLVHRRGSARDGGVRRASLLTRPAQRARQLHRRGHRGVLLGHRLREWRMRRRLQQRGGRGGLHRLLLCRRPPDVPADKAPGCFAAIVSNTWTTPVHLSAELAGAPLDVSKSVYRVDLRPGRKRRCTNRWTEVIPVGEAGVVFLAQGPDPTGHCHAVSSRREGGLLRRAS